MLKTKLTFTLLVVVLNSIVIFPSYARAQTVKNDSPSLNPILLEFSDHGLVGEFYSQPNMKNLPTLITLSGSDGNVATARSLGKQFASHEYAVLVLSYWRSEGLPQTLEEIPLEYFDGAIDWLAARPEVDSERIGILGWSKGAEAALLIASKNTKLKAILAIAPTFAVWPGINFRNPNIIKSSWTRNDMPIEFLPLSYDPGPVRDVEKAYLNAVSNIVQYPDVIIPVENIQGAILLMSGAEDKVWPAMDMGQRIIRRLKEKEFSYPADYIVYENAGHAVFVGGMNDTGGFANLRRFYGGTDKGNAAAWQDSWQKGLNFFEQHLKLGQ